MTPRWKDKLGRVWESTGDDTVVRVDNPMPLGHCVRWVVEEIVGPLEPVEPPPVVWRAKHDGWLWRAKDGQVEFFSRARLSWQSAGSTVDARIVAALAEGREPDTSLAEPLSEVTS